MNPYDLYRVDYFLLSAEWNEKGVTGGRVSYCLTGGETLEEHKKFCDEEIKRLLSENDDTYTSWVLTSHKTKEFQGILKFASVFSFRVRDAG